MGVEAHGSESNEEGMASEGGLDGGGVDGCAMVRMGGKGSLMGSNGEEVQTIGSFWS